MIDFNNYEGYENLNAEDKKICEGIAYVYETLNNIYDVIKDEQNEYKKQIMTETLDEIMGRTENCIYEVINRKEV